jgi:hypothetical protein
MHRTTVSGVALLALACRLWTTGAYAHPGSGIVVDDIGDVYFTYTGRGAAKLDPQGKLTIAYDNRGGHWMCLDRNGVFARTQPQFFRRVTPDGVKPAVIYADGGAPIAVSRDGFLEYTNANDGPDKGWRPRVRRVASDGRMTTLFQGQE